MRSLRTATVLSSSMCKKLAQKYTDSYHISGYIINTSFLFLYHSFLLEVNPNGGYVSRVEDPIGVLIEEARLANAGVAECQELYQIIVIHPE